MRIGILDVSHLVAVRKSLRLTWRLAASSIFLVLIFFWWAVFEKLLDNRWFGRFSLTLLAFLGLFSLIGLIGLFRPNAYSRALFAFTAMSSGLHLLALYPFALSATLGLQTQKTVKAIAFMWGLVLLQAGWFFVRTGFALCLILLPWRRCKVYRQQFLQCQRLWPGRRKTSATPPRQKPAQGSSLYASWLSAALPVLALASALLCFAACAVLMNIGFLPFIYHGEPGTAWQMLAALLGILGFYLFGFLWSRRQRARIPRDNTPPSRQMSADSVLLLRSFKDDVKWVPQRTFSLRRLLLGAYEWTFTFEKLIVARLASIGDVWVLGSEQDKLPPRGGIRRYLPLPTWQEEMLASMAIARMIVAVPGLTESMKWEIQQIKELDYRDKTVFLMPPLLLPGSYRKRWQVLLDAACEDPACREMLLKKVKPRKVLAACRRGNRLVIVTGESSQMAYESALDVAAIFTIGDPAAWDEIVPKQLA